MVTFSTIVSAVKPNERSDQYLVLGAMFFLNSHVESVTAKQIKGLLELDAPPVAVSRVGRDADGSGDFADVKLRFPGIIN